MEEDRVRTIKEKFEAQWLRIAGVNGVGIGYRERVAENVELVIVVYVTDLDLAKGKLPEQVEGVPVELREGRILPHSRTETKDA